jgi:acetylornithine deacetylase
MKGAIAAMVCAAAGFDRARLRKPLWLAFTFEEEIGCHGAKYLAEVAPLAVDQCIIGEPTGLRPVTLHKGYVIAEAHFRGTPCHSSDPDAGASAVHAAARAVDAVLRLGLSWRSNVPETPLVPPYPTINVGLISGGTARNVVPEAASFTIEMRPLPGSDPVAMLDAIEAEVIRSAASVPGVQGSLERLELDAPFGADPKGRLVSWLRHQTAQDPGSVPFYTEAAFFAGMGAEVCVCGPGEIAQAHRVDEWVGFDALGAAEILYRDAIEEFCT